MLTNTALKKKLEQYWIGLSPKERYRQGIFFSVIVLAVLVLGFTSYHIQSIPENLSSKIDCALVQRPWIKNYVVVDGQHIYLRGEIEPDSGLDLEIAAIEKISGVKKVSNVLEEIPKPSTHLSIIKNGYEITLGGKIHGDYLESIVSHAETGFPNYAFRDQIKIDDRLGRPLWLEGFDQSLTQLLPLENFRLDGWRDQIEISGTANNELLRRQVGYAIPASLVPGVKVVNRMTENVYENFPGITLVSDWRGSLLFGTVPSAKIRQQLLDASLTTFGEYLFESSLEIDENLLAENQLESLVKLLPTLSKVRDLRLQSSKKGFLVWGRVNDARELGEFLHLRNQLGLEQVVKNNIRVAAADKPASITLFSDQQNAVLNGILPTQLSKQQLIAEIKEHLGVQTVTDLVSIEPNIAHSDWLLKWPKLLSELPARVVGVTIDDTSMLVTGNADNPEQLAKLDQRLSMLFPETSRLNWMVVNN